MLFSLGTIAFLVKHCAGVDFPGEFPSRAAGVRFCFKKHGFRCVLSPAPQRDLVLYKMRGGIPDQGVIPPYLVLSKMRVASRIHCPSPLSSFYTKRRVATPTKWPSSLSGPIQNEGYHSGSSGYPPCLVLSKMRVASRIMGPSPLSASTQNEGGIPDQVAIHPIWSYPK